MSDLGKAVVRMMEAARDLALAACDATPAEVAHVATTMEDARRYADEGGPGLGLSEVVKAAADMIIRCTTEGEKH